MRLVIVTGISGAGKSTALKMLEDLGYFCIDNLPFQLIPKLAEVLMVQGAEYNKVALGMDIRAGQNISELVKALRGLKEQGMVPEVLFLDASDEILVKRYKETRRSHPLALGERVQKGIEKERQHLEILREMADYFIDTSNLLTRELKQELVSIFTEYIGFKSLYVTILSFGYKYGIPVDADLVFDVRFLPNPFYIEELKPKTGMDKEVQEYVLTNEKSQIFMKQLSNMVEFLIPNYIREGKHQLVIGIGCTGGKHRSVTIANALFKELKDGETYGLRIEHRDIEKDTIRKG